MGFCPKCGSYVFSRYHKCYPYTFEYEGEVINIYGKSFEDVVERYAREYNASDPIVGDAIFDEPVVVTNGDGESKKFNCYAEVVLEYSVEEEVG